MELSQEENQGQFVVHHEKLIEYGVVTQGDTTGDIKKRLDVHCMAENEDYVSGKFSQNSQKGGRPQNVYMLTPECFKTILIGANKHKKHTSDLLKYRKYHGRHQEAFRRSLYG